jgi:hypothetical protein
MSAQYVYIIQEREFIKTSENIFKVGKSKQENNKRINQYPKQSKLLLQIVCDNCDKLEKKLINIFKYKYNHRKDIGNEYFEGDHEDMIKNIFYTRNNIDNIINYEKIEKEKTQEELNRELLKKENDIKIQEEKKLLLKQEKEFNIKKKELLKELITKQKENEKKQKELIKKTLKKEKQNLKQIENEKKELEKIENDIKKKELQKIENEIKKKELEKLEDEIIKEQNKNKELEEIDVKNNLEINENNLKKESNKNISHITRNRNYSCKICNEYSTDRIFELIRHLLRQKQCIKTINPQNYSNDQLIIMSLIPDTKIDNLKINQIDKNNNVISNNKLELLDIIRHIDKQKIRKCTLCNNEFSKISELKEHLLLECFYKFKS